MHKTTPQSTLLVSLALLLIGCSDSPPSNLPVITMDVGSQSYKLEVATDESSREKGLMQRDSMPSGNGMIFVFQADSDVSFWMKNTRFPLDILYIDSDGKIVSIATMKPYSVDPTPSYGVYRFAIELNAGQAAATGLKKGDAIKIPADIRAKAGL